MGPVRASVSACLREVGNNLTERASQVAAVCLFVVLVVMFSARGVSVCLNVDCRLVLCVVGWCAHADGWMDGWLIRSFTHADLFIHITPHTHTYTYVYMYSCVHPHAFTECRQRQHFSSFKDAGAMGSVRQAGRQADIHTHTFHFFVVSMRGRSAVLCFFLSTSVCFFLRPTRHSARVCRRPVLLFPLRLDDRCVGADGSMTHCIRSHVRTYVHTCSRSRNALLCVHMRAQSFVQMKGRACRSSVLFLLFAV